MTYSPPNLTLGWFITGILPTPKSTVYEFNFTLETSNTTLKTLPSNPKIFPPCIGESFVN